MNRKDTAIDARDIILYGMETWGKMQRDANYGSIETGYYYDFDGHIFFVTDNGYSIEAGDEPRNKWMEWAFGHGWERVNGPSKRYVKAKVLERLLGSRINPYISPNSYFDGHPQGAGWGRIVWYQNGTNNYGQTYEQYVKELKEKHK
jgi:hypothetical protein